MKPVTVQSLWLRLRLALGRVRPVAGAAAVLCLAAGAALLWLVPERAAQARQHAGALRLAALPPPPVLVAGAPLAGTQAGLDYNLALFNDVLGERRYAEQQVRTLFGLAAKTGLTLSEGEYKGAWDRNGKFYTYQVTLPVKGSYRAIWRFGLLALRAMPFASLDELSFKRDAIGNASVEARLRLTMYLAGPAPAPSPGAVR